MNRRSFLQDFLAVGSGLILAPSIVTKGLNLKKILVPNSEFDKVLYFGVWYLDKDFKSPSIRHCYGVKNRIAEKVWEEKLINNIWVKWGPDLMVPKWITALMAYQNPELFSAIGESRKIS